MLFKTIVIKYKKMGLKQIRLWINHHPSFRDKSLLTPPDLCYAMDQK